MSATLDTVRTETDEAESEMPPASWIVGDTEAASLDVSDVPPGRVEAYARRVRAEVHFERKGGRTYLVAA